MNKYKVFENGYINKVTDEWGYVAPPPPMSDDYDGLDYAAQAPVPENRLNDRQTKMSSKPLTLKMKLARILSKVYR